jgi:hypothetical protein
MKFEEIFMKMNAKMDAMNDKLWIGRLEVDTR